MRPRNFGRENAGVAQFWRENVVFPAAPSPTGAELSRRRLRREMRCNRRREKEITPKRTGEEKKIKKKKGFYLNKI